MKINMSSLKPGTRVIYRPNFGNGEPREARLTTEATPHNSSYAVDLDNGHWCYVDQIDQILQDIELYEHETIVLFIDHKNKQALVHFQGSKTHTVNYNGAVEGLRDYDTSFKLIQLDSEAFRTYYPLFLEYASTQNRNYLTARVNGRQVADITLQDGIDFFRANGIEVEILD